MEKDFFHYDHTHPFLSKEWVRANFKTTEEGFVERNDGYRGHLWRGYKYRDPHPQFLVHNPDGVGVFVFAHHLALSL